MLDIGEMHGTGKARIEGMDGAQRLERTLGISHRRAQQSQFVTRLFSVVVLRCGEPGGGDHRLIVGDAAVLDDDPMRKKPAWRLELTDAGNLSLGKGRLIERRHISLADI